MQLVRGGRRLLGHLRSRSGESGEHWFRPTRIAFRGRGAHETHNGDTETTEISLQRGSCEGAAYLIATGAAKVIGPGAAKVIALGAAKVIRPGAAKVIGLGAAKVIALA